MHDPWSLQLEEACAQQWRPSTAKNRNKINFLKVVVPHPESFCRALMDNQDPNLVKISRPFLYASRNSVLCFSNAKGSLNQKPDFLCLFKKASDFFLTLWLMSNNFLIYLVVHLFTWKTSSKINYEILGKMKNPRWGQKTCDYNVKSLVKNYLNLTA